MVGGSSVSGSVGSTPRACLTAGPERRTATQILRSPGQPPHRTGPRNLAEMVGHSWQTAVFPSGRAFGLLRFPRPDGSVGFSEAWVYDGVRLVEATVVGWRLPRSNAM